MWSRLRRLLYDQVNPLRSFHAESLKYAEADEASTTVANTIKGMDHMIGSRFDKFDADSSALIQLQFNLTSIREAQKST
jgi:hypothetical protein